MVRTLVCLLMVAFIAADLQGYNVAAPGKSDLEQFFYSYKTGPVIHKAAHFFDIYEKYFSKFRQQKSVKMIEMGVQNGGSLNLWKHYFGKKLELHGIDVNPECATFQNKANNIYVHIGSQADPEFLDEIIREHGPFDIILDDASHQSVHMAAAFKHLYKHVRANGVYMVEDLLTNYWSNPEYNEGAEEAHTFVTLAKHLVDILNAFNTLDPRNHKGKKIHPTNFTRTTTGIYFHDSFVVFEKGPHQPSKDIWAGSSKVQHGHPYPKSPQNNDTSTMLNVEV